MPESVEVAGITVTPEVLQLMFDELRAHHWLSIPQQYKPRLARLRPTRGCVGTLESVVHDHMTDGTMPAWFKRQFMGGRAIVGTRDA